MHSTPPRPPTAAAAAAAAATAGGRGICIVQLVLYDAQKSVSGAKLSAVHKLWPFRLSILQ